MIWVGDTYATMRLKEYTPTLIKGMPLGENQRGVVLIADNSDEHNDASFGVCDIKYRITVQDRHEQWPDGCTATSNTNYATFGTDLNGALKEYRKRILKEKKKDYRQRTKHRLLKEARNKQCQ